MFHSGEMLLVLTVNWLSLRRIFSLKATNGSRTCLLKFVCLRKWTYFTLTRSTSTRMDVVLDSSLTWSKSWQTCFSHPRRKWTRFSSTKIDVIRLRPKRTRKLTNSFKSFPKMNDLQLRVHMLLVKKVVFDTLIPPCFTQQQLTVKYFVVLIHSHK